MTLSDQTHQDIHGCGDISEAWFGYPEGDGYGFLEDLYFEYVSGGYGPTFPNHIFELGYPDGVIFDPEIL